MEKEEELTMAQTAVYGIKGAFLILFLMTLLASPFVLYENGKTLNFDPPNSWQIVENPNHFYDVELLIYAHSPHLIYKAKNKQQQPLTIKQKVWNNHRRRMRQILNY